MLGSLRRMPHSGGAPPSTKRLSSERETEAERAARGAPPSAGPATVLLGSLHGRASRARWSENTSSSLPSVMRSPSHSARGANQALPIDPSADAAAQIPHVEPRCRNGPAAAWKALSPGSPSGISGIRGIAPRLVTGQRDGGRFDPGPSRRASSGARLGDTSGAASAGQPDRQHLRAPRTARKWRPSCRFARSRGETGANRTRRRRSPPCAALEARAEETRRSPGPRSRRSRRLASEGWPKVPLRERASQADDLSALHFGLRHEGVVFSRLGRPARRAACVRARPRRRSSARAVGVVRRSRPPRRRPGASCLRPMARHAQRSLADQRGAPCSRPLEKTSLRYAICRCHAGKSTIS